MKELFNKLATRNGIIALFIIQIGLRIWMNQPLNKLSNISDKGIPDFEFGYSLETINGIFESFGETGRSLYNQVLLVDIFNPLSYALLLAVLCFVFYKNTQYERLAYLPLIVGGLDYLENVFLYLMNTSFPNISTSIVGISNVVSMVKHVFLYIAVLVFLIGLVRWVLSFFKK